MSTRELTIAEIHALANDDNKLTKLEYYLELINRPPPKEWIAKHQFISGHQYLPIDKVEYLLKAIFKLYKIEVLSKSVMLDSVEVTVRVHYFHPVLKEWLFSDGVGAWELQTNKGTGKLKLDNSNLGKSAVTMALPIAKSEAIKDACDLIGDVFGGNLTRKNTIAYMADQSIIAHESSKQQYIEKTVNQPMPEFEEADNSVYDMIGQQPQLQQQPAILDDNEKGWLAWIKDELIATGYNTIELIENNLASRQQPYYLSPQLRAEVMKSLG